MSSQGEGKRLADQLWNRVNFHTFEENQMSTPFIGEVRIFGFNFSPKGWAKCDGQLLPIMQNQALYALLGTTYGGNGQTTFALPDLRGRAQMHVGSQYSLGQRAGEENHTLTINELPAHSHPAAASSDNAATQNPAGGVLAGAANLYGGATTLQALIPATVSPQGGGQAHPNMQPYLVVNICIALQGLFPSRN
jgi:microcystin-dependent protein